MLLVLPTLLAFFSITISSAHGYQAVVVNATTSRPIVGVSITDLQTQK